MHPKGLIKIIQDMLAIAAWVSRDHQYAPVQKLPTIQAATLQRTSVVASCLDFRLNTRFTSVVPEQARDFGTCTLSFVQTELGGTRDLSHRQSLFTKTRTGPRGYQDSGWHTFHCMIPRCRL